MSCSKEGADSGLVASLCQVTALQPAREAHSKTLLLSGKGSRPTYSHLAQHYPSGQHCYNEPQWLCFPRTGAPASLDFWGRAPSPVKAWQYHVTGVLGCMAWYKKAALCLHEQGDTGSSKDGLHYTQLSENKMFQLQA